MGFLGDIASLIGGLGTTMNQPTSATQETYVQPTFDPEVYKKILAAMPGVDVEGLSGYGMQYDPKSGKMTTTRGGSQTAGGAYSDKMKQYIESMGEDLYQNQVLPGLQRRGVLSQPGGQVSREETLGTKDWGRVMTQQGLQAEAKGIDLEQAGQKDLLSQLQTALGVGVGTATTAAGKKQWGTQTFYY